MEWGALADHFGGAVMMMAMQIGQKALLPPGERMEPPPKQGLLPRLGALPRPSKQPLEKAAMPLGSHVVFGVAADATLRALDRVG